MDKQKFGEIVLMSETTLYRVAKSILISDADCEDAVAEGVAKAFAKLHILHHDEYAKTWLVRIVINECRHMYNNNIRCVAMENINAFHSEDTAGHQNEYSRLYEALGKLREEDRITVVLHYIEGFQVKEIAVMMNVTQGTVKSRLSRSRQKLKDDLTEGLR